MATILLLIIYISFIGLGIPDSLFGTAWPAIYTEFQLPISFASFVTVLISCGTVASSMASAGIIMYYYLGMALGRFLSGLLAARLGSWQIIGIGQCLLGAAVLFLLLPAPAFVSAAGLFITGLGNGPLFPNFNYLTPQNFGEEASQSVMGTQMAASYLGIMLAPALCGILGQRIHMGIFPVYVLALYLLMLAATYRAKKILPR